MKIIPILAFAVLLVFSGYVQGCPKINYSENVTHNTINFSSFYRNNRRCRVVYYTGTIKSLRYENAQSVDLTLDNSNKKVQVALNNDSLDYFSEADKQKFIAQMKEGIKVSIGAFVCGTGRKAHKQIFSIELI